MDGPDGLVDHRSCHAVKSTDKPQDAFDIITGGYVARRGGIPPLTDTRPLLMRAVSLLISGA